jgi:hypothetical protein
MGECFLGLEFDVNAPTFGDNLLLLIGKVLLVYEL